MRIYNTLTKKVEEFIPHNDKNVTMYTCGPTVYNYAHIGNLRTYLFEDFLERGLNYLGYNVKRVMNITDVGHIVHDADIGEDKMSNSAKKEGKTAQEIAEFYTKKFLEDLAKLNIKKPEIIEKATSHINDYIKVIETLLEKRYAYQAGGNIYFDISKMPNYYQLSGRTEENQKIAVRDDVTHDLYKKNPYDFVLWFTKSKFEDQEQKWDSPWGVGYPGWHIECSTLANLYLGEYLDLHCGGVDLIFPHHTNEIAQSEAYFGHKWCNYWVHGEYLNDETGKMSKSKGDFLTLSFLESKKYLPLAYRYFCLGSHYRKQLTFSYDALNQAQNTYMKLKNKVLSLKDDGNIIDNQVRVYEEKFKDAINNDLNTSLMLTLVYEVLKDKNLNDKTKKEIIKSFDKVLGLDLLKKEEIKLEIDEKYILDKIEERKKAKENKDYLLADKIREELLNKNIRLIDTKDNTTYEIINL